MICREHSPPSNATWGPLLEVTVDQEKEMKKKIAERQKE